MTTTGRRGGIARRAGLRSPAPFLALAACGVLAACGDAAPTPTDRAPAAVRTPELDRVAADARSTPPPSAAPVTAEGLRAHLLGLPPDRPIGSEAHRRTREWIVATLEGFGLSPRVEPFDWDSVPDAKLANVEVRLPGASPEAPLLVVGAHFDSVPGTPGADDNGSGVVALLELARRLSGSRLQAEVRLVWFDAEEPGLIGSGAWVRALSAADGRRCLGAIVLETLGYTDRRPGSQSLPPGVSSVHDPGDVGDFLSVLGNLASVGLAERVGRALERERGPAFRVDVFSWLPGDGSILPDARRSDHSRFWDAGLPALLLTDTANFRSPHYHRRSDTLDTLDLEFLAAATRGVERAVRDISGAREEPREER